MARTKKKASASSEQTRFGIGEWYGERVARAPVATLHRFAEIGGRASDLPCPFRRAADPAALCKKKGGACSLQLYEGSQPGPVTPVGPLVTLCPSRFWQENTVFKEIGKLLLQVEKPDLVKEVQFLSELPQSDQDEADDDELGGAVGRIDTILVDPADRSRWCAVEIQAVYFSGDGMKSHRDQYLDPEGVPVWPDKARRPDFRSSGPKRLMPQLQTKVPTLRRWGRKMAVVVDKPFFCSLGDLRSVKHVSNSDIIWIVVDYDERTGDLFVAEKVATTLEASVEALTAGVPLSQEQFEAQVAGFLQGKTKQARAKVIRLSDPQPSADGGSLLPEGAELPEGEGRSNDGWTLTGGPETDSR